MSYLRRSLALVGAAALAFSVAPATAQAEEARVQAPQSGLAKAGPTGILADSEFFAGVNAQGGNSGAQATFKVPRFSCAEGETSGVLKALEAQETGSGFVFTNGGGGVFLICENGEESILPVLFDPSGAATPAPIVVNEGDKIRVTYLSDPTGQTASSMIENLTTGEEASSGAFTFFNTTNVMVGDFAVTFDGTTTAPVPNFKKNKFSKVTIDGVKLKRGGAEKFNLVDAEGNTILKTSKIKRGGFTIRNLTV